MTKSRFTVRAILMAWLAVTAVRGLHGRQFGRGTSRRHSGGPATGCRDRDRQAGPECRGRTSANPNAKTDPHAKSESEPAPAILAQWKKHVEQWKAIDPREAADNSFCYVCHANYEGEKLVKVHEAEGVGCETCHGMSDKHSQDEDSLVPPDVIFAPAKVASFCGQCHEKRDLLDGDEAHEKFFAGQVEPAKTCTGCHDMKHVLKVRTRRWNKETREIEWYDGVRMMQQHNKQQPKE